MIKLTGFLCLLALAACSGIPTYVANTPSPCATDEASYACQVERYHNVNVP